MSMKVASESLPPQETWLKPLEFDLPAGLIGFADLRRVELIVNPGELPFMWLRDVDNHALNFVVVEPLQLFPGYTIDLADEDAARLAITTPGDTLIFNIVNIRDDEPEAATVNLIGPIVVNRHTRAGRQVVITNYADYSARHPLLASAAAL